MDTEKAIINRSYGADLENITKLNLSSLGLKTLDEKAFEKLKCLEFLDISSNNLTTIPPLELPRLKRLFCDLNMFTNVLFTKNFPLLEELFLSGNPLSLADRYIAVSLLPNLIKLDSRDCSQLREADRLTSERLRPQIQKVWGTHFSSCLTVDLSDSQLDTIQNQLICHMKRIRASGLDVPSGFKQFKAEEMAKELFKEKVEELRNSQKLTTVSLSPRKSSNNQMSLRSPKNTLEVENITRLLRSSPRKDCMQDKTNHSALTIQNKSPKKSIDTLDVLDELVLNKSIRMSPRKSKVSGDISQDEIVPCTSSSVERRTSPRKRKELDNTSSVQNDTSLVEIGTVNKEALHTRELRNNRRVKRSFEVENDGHDETSSKKLKSPPRSPSKNVTTVTHCKNLFGSPKSRTRVAAVSDCRMTANYFPKLFLRCHSRENNPADCATQVWCAAFEPDVLNPGTTTNIVASCGGTNVCLIDCTTGQVMKCYKHCDPDEDFYCLAWTVVQIEKSMTTLLAVAGHSREVVLIHPLQLVCYHSFKAASKDINCLAFHQTKPTWLLTGSSDKTISIWDIGIPSCPDYKTVCKKLLILDAGFEVLQLGLSVCHNLLIGACDGALLAWQLDSKSIANTKQKPQFQFELSEFKSKKTTTVDGLYMLSDKQFAVKVAGSGKILICNLEDSLKAVKSPRKSDASRLPLVVVSVLEWSNCKTAYLYLKASEDRKILACGDDEGSVWVYDIQNIWEKDFKSSKIPCKPCRVLAWPDIEQDNDKLDLPDDEKISINSTAFSSDGQYLFACSDKNFVCIWKSD